ncbi:hypothetical protein FQR65_LT18084 [Abscondita terminalis]|nr:hypothetical protein FQR65_LT18084 [Abscondita terminalis]
MVTGNPPAELVLSSEEIDLIGVQTTIEEMIVCFHCGVLYSESDINNHIKSTHDSNFCNEFEEIKTKNKYTNKKNFCIYCKSLQSQLPRHLQRKHKNEDTVKEIMALQKDNPKRKQILKNLLQEGNFLYNSMHEKIIPHRRSLIKESSKKQYVPCPFCKGFYSKTNLRNHVRLNCQKKPSTVCNMRNLQADSRAMLPEVHPRANKKVREDIFPKLVNDEVTRIAAHDLYIIEYINLMSIKYSSSAHHNKMIRNKMRHLGRILLEMSKNYNTVTDISSIFQPCNFDNFIKTVNCMAGLTDGKFNAPSFGPASITLMKKMGRVIETFAIKDGNREMQTNVENFLKLLETMGNPLVSKVAQENRTQLQRSKKIVLPKIEDIHELYSKLRLEIKNCIAHLKNKFENDIWIRLSKATLVHITIFNRRRPGDVERSQILEYKNLERVSQESLELLNNHEKCIATKYARYITRGKLNSPAPLLVSELDMAAIQTILHYRRDAKISNDNPYLFAHPPGTTNQFFSGGLALQNFCCDNKLQNKNLTATKLRKHLATVTGALEHKKIQMVSDFMGHSVDIHQKIYNQRTAVKDICQMGGVLLSAVGVPYNDIHSDNNEEDISKHTTNEEHISDDTLAPGPSNSNFHVSNAVEAVDSFASTEFRTPVHSDNDDDYSDCSVYQPDLSTIPESSDSEECSKGITRTKKGQKRKTIKYSETTAKRRITWSTPERKEVKTLFHNYLQDGEPLPSLETCEEFKQRNPVLNGRTSMQIRAWIQTQKKRDSGNQRRSGWTTPTNELCRSRFKTFYVSKRYPTQEELLAAIDSEPLLHNTTIFKLRSHLQHDYKYLVKTGRIKELSA